VKKYLKHFKSVSKKYPLLLKALEKESEIYRWWEEICCEINWKAFVQFFRRSLSSRGCDKKRKKEEKIFQNCFSEKKFLLACANVLKHCQSQLTAREKLRPCERQNILIFIVLQNTEHVSFCIPYSEFSVFHHNRIIIFVK